MTRKVVLGCLTLIFVSIAADANDPAVQSLVNRLDHPLWSARRDAAESLALHEPLDESAIVALVDSLDDDDARVRRAAVQSLAGSNSHFNVATAALVSALADDDWVVRHWAARSFKGRDVGPAISTIGNLLDSESNEIKLSTANALAGLAPQSRAVLPQLITALESDDWRVRSAAANAIGALGPDAIDALPALADALRDRDWGVAEQVVEALSEIGEPAIPVLIEALQDRSLVVRWGAARSTGRIGDGARAAVPALSMTLQDESLQARWAAAKSLWAIGPAAAEAVPALVAALSDSSWVVRWSAARALGASSTSAGIDATVATLAIALRDRDSRVCEAAAFALEAIGEPAIAALPALSLAATGRSVDESAATLPCQVIDVGPAAEQLMMDTGWTVRWAAVRALGVIGTDRQIANDALEIAMRDEQWQVRGVAVLAAGQFRKVPGSPLLAAMTKALDDENESVRKAARAALANNSD